MQHSDIENRFTYHPPTVERAESHAATRDMCMHLAVYLNRVLPEGREKSLAITHVEETMMWANAAIARQGE